ncbi:hypothetical protein [Microbacterium sp.]|uniref:hypothetical protein n=1 Tax=Microbacterium sp. TaxID=51671 RepID=UPI003C1700B7
MKILTYTGAELMTGDDIADAVLDYCVALAEESTAETIEIPVLKPDGSRGTASLLVGPASQIVATQVDTDFDELIDEQTIRLLHTRTLAHRPVAQHSDAQQFRDFDDSQPNKT